MSTRGSLTDFSLTEIFQFIEKGRRTGLLTIRVLPESQATLSPVHYIWVYKGCIVAAANRLDQQGLISLIEQHQWASNHLLTTLDKFCPIDKPLGLSLRNQGALQSEQLKQLFYIQVLQRVCALCQLKDAQFQFDQNLPIPAREMTGLSVPAVVLRMMIEAVNQVQKLVDNSSLNRRLCTSSR
jgi:hypothetical protein